MSNGGDCAPMKQTEISKVTERLSSSIVHLNSGIKDLESRLKSVLVETPDTQKTETEQPHQTKLAGELDNYALSIESATQCIKEIRDRLEL